MFSNIINQINWVDFLIVIILFRACCIAAQQGLPVEIFKFLGIISAIYLSLHYYIDLSNSFSSYLTNKSAPLEFADFVAFSILAVIGYLIFVWMRIAFYRFIKMDAVPALSKWGGLVLGVGRGILIVGLITYLFFISSMSYLRKSVVDSYLGKRFLKVAPATYSWTWNNFASKFMPKEKFNKTVLEIENDFPVK